MNKTILGICISIERNVLVTDQFIQSPIRKYGKHKMVVSKDSDCKLKHIMNWLSLFVDMHNREITGKIVSE